MDELGKEPLDLTHVTVHPRISTPISFIIPSIEHNHVVLSYKGAYTTLTEKDTPLSIKDYDYVYVAPLSGHSMELLHSLARQAYQSSIPFAINPNIAQILHDEQFLPTLSSVSLMIVNAYEARHCMRRMLADKPPKVDLATINNRNDSTELPALLSSFVIIDGAHYTLFDYFKRLFSYGVSLAVVTNGAEGVYAATPELTYFHPSLKSKVIVALGAGDAFGSAFIAKIAQDKTIEEALISGIINAQSVISFTDAKTGLLTTAELDQRTSSLGMSSLKKIPFPSYNSQ